MALGELSSCRVGTMPKVQGSPLLPALKLDTQTDICESPLESKEKIQSENVRYQTLWDAEWIGTNKRPRHRQVAALLFSWDDQGDDLGVREEVKRPYPTMRVMF